MASFLRRHAERILHEWEARVTAEIREVELTGLALRDDVSGLLDCLAAWLATNTPPDGSPLATSALGHAMERLDAGLSLAQLMREYRLLRECILEALLGAEQHEQARTGAAGGNQRIARVIELARLNAGLDVALESSIERFVEERDRRAATQRFAADQAARDSDLRYRSLFESIDEGCCLIEVLFEGGRPVDYRFLEVNPAFARHTGQQNATGRRIRELVPNHDEHWFETYGRVACTGRPERFESFARALGRFYDVYAFRIGDPAQHQVAVLFNDKTQRKRAEDSLRASEAMGAFLLQLSDSLRPLTDPIAIQATVTRMGRQHFEADRCYYCELVENAAIIRQDDARPGQPSVVGTYRLDEMPLFRATIDAGRPLVVEDAHTSPILDAGLRKLCLQLHVVSFIAVPIIKDGKASGVLCVTHAAPRTWTRTEIALATETAERTWAALEHARALAARREANERWVEADRHENEFLAVLSHELRNPLAPIRSGVFILEHAPPGGEQAVRAWRVIDRQAQHMTRLIEDLLDVTRISRGKIALQRQHVDLSSIVATAAEDHRDLFTRTGIELEVVEAGQPIWVDGDRTRLAQVLGNLLTNSAKFTPRGGKTAVTVEERHGRAVVRVRDTGVGMTPETQARLFQPFVQAAQTIERTRGGLGLGLALVKGLVELHQGTVSVSSSGEGKGSEFVVTLPSCTPERPTVSPSERPATSPQVRRVLVVEDNVDAAETLREALTLVGHDVTLAYSGPDGLEAARAQKPDVILCDIGLPGLDGYAVARSIRADSDIRLRGTFLVALSGYALPEDVTKSTEAGFDRHMAKPPNLDALEALLRSGAATAP